MKNTIKVVMMRKVASAQEWLKKATEDGYGISVDAVVEKTITVPETAFREMAENLLDDNTIIMENQDSMWVNRDKIWHVIKINCKELPYELYINSEGYAYARYTGIRVKKV